MGQIFLQNGEMRKAIHAFSLIPDDHPEYIHAQHATAVAHTILGSDMKDVVTALENVISSSPRTKEDQEIVNRSYLFMGLIFYEESALSKAVLSLRQVPPTSYYAEDALLGQGWTALKARQWNDCISVGQQLVRMSQKPILRCEGMLIQSYGYLMQKDYPKSLELIKTAYDLSQTLTPPDEDSLSMRTLQNENNRLSYSQMAGRVEEIALMGQTAHLTGVIDSLRGRSNIYVGGFHDYDRYRHEFQRTTFFARTIDQVKEDLEFALATVQKIAGAAGATGADRRAIEQQKEIDAEIERLKREMEAE
jgi:hypothetical protein